MDSELPDPLVPPEVDLRDITYFPLEITRLFGSEFHAHVTDAEWRAGVTLWCKSFHQCPAASLPDDDVVLARLAEYGRDVDAWRAVKMGAMRGWIKCSDGRFYHPFVAQRALEAWLERLSQRRKSRLGNAARWKIDGNADAIVGQIQHAMGMRTRLCGTSQGDSSGNADGGSGKPSRNPSGNPPRNPSGNPPRNPSGNPTGIAQASPKDSPENPTGVAEGIPVRSQGKVSKGKVSTPPIGPPLKTGGDVSVGGNTRQESSHDPPDDRPPKVSDDEWAVFDHWRRVMAHPRAKLDRTRLSRIRTTLKAYAVDDLKQAINGCAVTPHNMGESDGQVHDGLHVIFKTPDNIDRFIRNAQDPPQPRAPAAAKGRNGAAPNGSVPDAKPGESWEEYHARKRREVQRRAAGAPEHRGNHHR